MYASIRDVTNADTLHVTLKELKGKIIRLNHGPNQRLFLGSEEQEKQNDEQPTLFHLLRQRRRQQSRLISKVQECDGNTYTSSRDIQRAFTEHLKYKFDTICVEMHSIRAMMEGVEIKQIPPEANEVLQKSITKEELRKAV
jgi:hypothetical protein